MKKEKKSRSEKQLWKQYKKRMKNSHLELMKNETLKDLKEEHQIYYSTQDHGFKIHMGITAGISAFLIFLNALVEPFPFSIIVTGALAIPFWPHLANWLTVRKEKEELENIESLEPEGLEILRKFLRKRRNLRVVQYTGGGIVGFLTLLNLILSFTGDLSFPHLMSLIPGAAILLPIAVGTFSVKNALKNLKQKLTPLIKTGNKKSGIKPGSPESGISEIQADAQKIAKKINAQLDRLGGDSKDNFSTIRTEVEHYITLFGTINKQQKRLDHLLDDNKAHLLSNEMENFQNRLEGTQNEALQLEYKKAINQINQQLTSVKELEDQKELLVLKAKNGLNTLKQLNLDLVKEDIEATSLEGLKERSDELSQYLKDLSDSYNSL